MGDGWKAGVPVTESQPAFYLSQIHDLKADSAVFNLHIPSRDVVYPNVMIFRNQHGIPSVIFRENYIERSGSREFHPPRSFKDRDGYRRFCTMVWAELERRCSDRMRQISEVQQTNRSLQNVE